ncbi:MAG TPA: LLM class flavin-dependent oxidoreductase [Candidatus Binataceae bacterium]|nr:LLM class flavin-dependent oxidoreductase [Candidatus Binataceae bacterium]
MKFGMLHLFENPAGKTEHQVLKEEMSLMRGAEDLGFDSIWASEHHFSEYGICASPALTLAALAPVTKTIRLGTGVTVLPFNHPVRIAEEIALLDLISDGRVDFGVGRGFQPIEYRGFHIDQSHSHEIFDEALDIVLQAWTQQKLNYPGKHFKFEVEQVMPKPLQKPHPPVWIAAVSADSFGAAGKRGLNLLCAPVFGFYGKAAAQMIKRYHDGLRLTPHPSTPRDIGALCMVYCAETEEQARREFTGPVLWTYRTLANYIAPPPGQQAAEGYELYEQLRSICSAVNWEDLKAAGAVICGDRDSCIEQISTLKERLGCTQLLCWTRMGGLESAKVTRSMELMSKYVIPHFKADETAGVKS